MTRRSPVDTAARDRLRKAQADETAALHAVDKAQARLAGAENDLAAVTARHQEKGRHAATDVDEARDRLVTVCGLSRAAMLQDLPASQLRRAGRAKDSTRA